MSRSVKVSVNGSGRVMPNGGELRLNGEEKPIYLIENGGF
jgi:hypothetical protein